MTAEFTGWHVLAEFGGVDANLCDDLERLETALRKSLVAAGVTICDVVRKKFEPQGVTILALLAESHASIQAQTMRLLADPRTTPGELSRPGHVFPLRANAR
ncbi:S-adenosylmethionine decarboxylase, partial [Nocardia sp. NPDC004722]